MGDGPAYDYAYARAEKAAADKKATQAARAKALHVILTTVGFGETDGNLSALEGQAAAQLRAAYETFSLLGAR